MAAGAGGVGDWDGTVGCETAPGTLVPGAVPLEVVLDCGSVPVATVGNGAAESCACTLFAIWVGLWPEAAIWASCAPVSMGGCTAGVGAEVEVEDGEDGEAFVGDDVLVDDPGVVWLAIIPACAGMLRLRALKLCAVVFNSDGGTLLYCAIF